VSDRDNTPEWGTCKAPGCKEPAYPIWYTGGEPDDPDLLLCEAHIGARILELETARKAATERGAADHAVAEAARALAAGPDSTAWERLYAALAVADKVGKE
jgi:hypothetical protein